MLYASLDNCVHPSNLEYLAAIVLQVGFNSTLVMGRFNVLVDRVWAITGNCRVIGPCGPKKFRRVPPPHTAPLTHGLNASRSYGADYGDSVFPHLENYLEHILLRRGPSFQVHGNPKISSDG